MTLIQNRAASCNDDLHLEIANKAYAVFSALMRAGAANPELRGNSLWKFYVKQSYERFEIAFGVE